MSEQDFQRQQDNDEDPLAELARIVSGEDNPPATSSAPGQTPPEPDQGENWGEELPEAPAGHNAPEEQGAAKWHSAHEEQSAPEAHISEDLPTSEPVQRDDSQIGSRLAVENMDLESQLMAELSTAPVPQVSVIPELPPRVENDSDAGVFARETAASAQMQSDIAASQATNLATADAPTVDDALGGAGIDQLDFTAAFNEEFQHSAPVTSEPAANATYFAAAEQPAPAITQPGIAQPDFEQPDVAQPDFEQPAVAQPDPAPFVSSANYNQLERQVDESVQEIRDSLADSMSIEDAFSDVFANELSLEMAGVQGETASQPQARSDYVSADGDMPVASEISNSEQLRIDPSQSAAQAAQRGGKKTSGFKLAAGALGLAILTGSAVVGYGLLGGNNGSDEPVLVRADRSDFKVKPEQPGGKKITSQDQPVYDTMDKANLANNSGVVNDGTLDGDVPNGAQDRLVANNEAPVELASRSTPGAQRLVDNGETQPAKSVDRLAGDSNLPEKNTPIAFVQPRKVKTVSVRADGSIVATLDEGPLANTSLDQAANGVTAINGQVTKAAIDGAISTGKIAIPVQNPKSLAISAPGDVTNTIKISASGTPSSDAFNLGAPRQPVDNQPIALASVPSSQTRLLAPSSEAYAVQISSQRSLEAAEASYQNLKRRFAGLLTDKPREIREGELEGKGTFYRVRIPFEQKSAATDFCTRYKSAGGSCFVTK